MAKTIFMEKCHHANVWPITIKNNIHRQFEQPRTNELYNHPTSQARQIENKLNNLQISQVSDNSNNNMTT